MAICAAMLKNVAVTVHRINNWSNVTEVKLENLISNFIINYIYIHDGQIDEFINEIKVVDYNSMLFFFFISSLIALSQFSRFEAKLFIFDSIRTLTFPFPARSLTFSLPSTDVKITFHFLYAFFLDRPRSCFLPQFLK